MTFLADDKEAAGFPFATSIDDMILPSQHISIRQRTRAAGVDPDAECLRHLRCRTEDLSRRAATAFIEHLERLAAPVEEVK